jgi:hypothetical protein
MDRELAGTSADEPTEPAASVTYIQMIRPSAQ